MAYITIDDLQKFTGVYPDENKSLQSMYVNAATDIVNNYLGYSAELQTRTNVLSGNDTNIICLNAKPIVILTSVSIDGVEQNIANFVFDDTTEQLTATNNITFKKGNNNVVIKFTAGFNDFPKIIQLTTLRIAGCLQTEGDNNIGINSKSFGDSGTRVFTNTVSFDKYLRQISKYKLL